jgi:hypothetical protein
MKIIISEAVLLKLKVKHKVSEKEVSQCFLNRSGGILLDSRDEHKTQPQTFWFVAPTNNNRLLKIIYISDGNLIFIKSAYDAKENIVRIYEKYA